jgi:hypothetical protein
MTRNYNKTTGWPRREHNRPLSTSETTAYQVLDPVVAAVCRVRIQLETEAASTLLNDTATNIGGHDEQSVLKVDSPPLRVCQPPIFKNLRAGKQTRKKLNRTIAQRTIGKTYEAGIRRCQLALSGLSPVRLQKWKELRSQTAAVVFATKAPPLVNGLYTIV